MLIAKHYACRLCKRLFVTLRGVMWHEQEDHDKERA
jgi:hypothetical protein